jgi:hypothetical protein
MRKLIARKAFAVVRAQCAENLGAAFVSPVARAGLLCGKDKT